MTRVEVSYTSVGYDSLCVHGSVVSQWCTVIKAPLLGTVWLVTDDVDLSTCGTGLSPLLLWVAK